MTNDHATTGRGRGETKVDNIRSLKHVASRYDALAEVGNRALSTSANVRHAGCGEGAAVAVGGRHASLKSSRAFRGK